MSRRSDAISPTAHYTGHTWVRHGLSHPALSTPQGRVLHAALRPWMAAARFAGAPTLDAFLLARHRAIDRVLDAEIAAGRITQVIEIAAGLSPRGWDFKRRHGPALRYLEADLPDMAARKHARLASAGLLTAGHEVVALDARAEHGASSLAALAAGLDPQQGLAIVTEGLLNYFDRDTVEGLWRRVAGTLSRFPHGLYLSDLHLSAHHRSAATRGFVALLSTFVRGRVHLHYADAAAAGAALRASGFEQADLHPPQALLPGERLLPGAGLVRVIEARCGA